MADALGAFATSYELDVALKLDISEMVTQLSPFDAPFQGTYNGLENVAVPSILPTGSVFERQYDWLEDELLVPRGTLATNYIAGTEDHFEVQTGEASRFQVDDLIDVGGVIYHITAVNYTTDELSIAAAGTTWSGTDASATAGDTVFAVGTLPAEGSDPGEARATDRTRLHNFTQIIGPYPVEMSETEQVVAKYGVASEWAWQTTKRVKEAVISLEQAILYGVRKDDTNAKRRTFGGLNYFIDASFGATVTSSVTSLDESVNTSAPNDFRTLQQDCYNNGGQPQLAVVSPANRVHISDWRRTDIRTARNDSGRGQVVSQFESDFGVVDVLMHRYCKNSDLFLFNREQAELCTMVNREWKWVTTAKTGDRDQAYIIAEKGFKFHAARHAAKFDSLS